MQKYTGSLDDIRALKLYLNEVSKWISALKDKYEMHQV